MGKTIRNPETGRFERVEEDANETQTSTQTYSEKPQNISQKISQTVANILEATARLECNLNGLGVIHGTPFSNSRDPNAECGDDSDSKDIFSSAYSNVMDHLRSETSMSQRPYNIVRTSVLNGLRALALISSKGVAAFSYDSGVVDRLIDFTERNMSDYEGLYDTENFFNEISNFSREILGMLSCNLIGYGTEHIDGEDATNYEMVSCANLRDHLMGVSNVISTIYAHLSWLNAQIEENLL